MADTDDPFALTPSSPLVTVADPRPAPTDDKAQARIDKLHSLSEESVTRAERSMAHEDDIREERMRGLAPIRQRMSDLAAQPLPQIPETKAPPAVPERPNQQDQETWLMASGLLGALAGAFTRRHQTNALAAFAGAMDGYNEGSRQKYDQNMKIWEAENKKALEENSRAMDHYRSILENRKLSMDQMSIQLQMAAQQYDDAGMAAAAQTKNALVIAQHYDKEAEAAGRARTSSESLSLKYQQMQQKERLELAKQQMRAIGINDPAKMQDTIDAIGQYRAAPMHGKAGTAIMDLVRQQYPEYDENEWTKKKFAALIPLRAKAAEETSSARVAATRETQYELILSGAKPALEMAAQAARDLSPTTTFVPVNRLAQYGLEQIGDESLKVFKMANQTLSEFWARSMNPTGTMAVTLFNQAKENLDTATSREAYFAQLRYLNSLLDREIHVIEDERERLVARREGRPEPPRPAIDLSITPRSTTIPEIPGALRQKESELGERSGIHPSGALPTTPPQEAIRRGQWGIGVDWIKPEERRRFMEMLPGWKVDQVSPPASSNMPLPAPAPGWKVEQVQ